MTTTKFKNYTSGYRIVALALDLYAKQKLLTNGLSVLYMDIDTKSIILLPDDIVLSNQPDDLTQVQAFNNYDVFELWENGLLVRKYNDKSNDNYFFVTGKCNSNCIICPSSEYSRKNSETISLANLTELAKYIPSDVAHMTITGGEPFLTGDKIFTFLRFLKEKFTDTEFLFLTNGRVFALDKYVDMFYEFAPNNSIVAIPLHGSCSRIHDAITRTDNSFLQTTLGIKHLLLRKIPVEIRIVVNKLNIRDFDNIAQLIVDRFKQVEYVSIIAMEMTGTARVNQKQVWIPYKASFPYIAEGIRILIHNGIDVKLYNFPVCTVEKPFWTLCEKSISDDKVRYGENCGCCKYKKSCCGVFAGTLQLEKDELKPIL